MDITKNVKTHQITKSLKKSENRRNLANTSRAEANEAGAAESAATRGERSGPNAFCRAAAAHFPLTVIGDGFALYNILCSAAAVGRAAPADREEQRDALLRVRPRPARHPLRLVRREAERRAHDLRQHRRAVDARLDRAREGVESRQKSAGFKSAYATVRP